MSKILVIDDEDDFRNAVVRALRSKNFAALEADNGHDGLQLALTQQPDVVITDVNLAESNGFSILSSLRHDPATASIPVIMMTGSGDEASIRRGMAEGADDFLIKPFPWDSFLGTVEAQIRKRRMISQQSEETKERLVSILEATADLVAIADVETERILFLNRAGRSMTAQPLDGQLAGSRIRDLLPLSPYQFLTQEAIPIAVTQGAWSGESFLFGRNGVNLPVFLRVQAHRNARGKLEFLSLIARDVTEQKEFARRLSEKETFVRAVLNSLTANIAVLDRQGTIVAVNEPWERFARTNGDLLLRQAGVGINYLQVVENARELPPEKTRDMLEGLRGILEGCSKEYQVEYACHSPGTQRWYTMHATPLPQGQEGAVVAHLNITDRVRAEQALRQSQNRFHLLMKASQTGFWDWDLVTNEIYLSPEWKGMLGYEDQELENRLESWESRLHPEDRDHALATIRRNQADPWPNYELEFRLRHKDGSYRWILTRSAALLDELGQPRRMMGVHLDITKRKQEETERSLMEIQLRHAQKLESIGQLAAGIAHEINTPTQYIGDNTRFLKDAFHDLSGFVSQFQEWLRTAKEHPALAETLRPLESGLQACDWDYLSAEIPKAIGQSLEGVARVSKIVRAMKEFSHPGSQEKTPLDLNQAIESTITVARNEWKYVADMVTEFDPALPPVPCLADEFNQVILNLIINATHAIADVVGDGSQGKGTITVTTRADGDWAEILVRDTGTGIPEKIRDRIFEPFFTTKAVGKGTGQGLAITHSIITEKHGGTLTFRTETGAGSTFIIRLPFHPHPPKTERATP
jgi:two-component system, NtrC family, sensor kinase